MGSPEVHHLSWVTGKEVTKTKQKKGIFNGEKQFLEAKLMVYYVVFVGGKVGSKFLLNAA